MFLTKLCSKASRQLLRNHVFTTNHATKRFMELAIENVPDVSPASLKRAFNSHNLAFEEGYTCFTLKCSICSSNKKNDPQKIFVNKTTGKITVHQPIKSLKLKTTLS